MVALFAVSLALQPVAADPVVELCKPTLARKVDGEIATIDVSSRRMIGHRQIIEGRLSAFAHMGPAPAGFARTHHVGRIEFTYRCEVSKNRVRKARVNPLGG